MYANGMGISFHTEPHILTGSVSPTIGRRNITLPTDNGLNSIEWRLRKEQTKGKVTVFGRKLRVSPDFSTARGKDGRSERRKSQTCLQIRLSIFPFSFRPTGEIFFLSTLTATHARRRFMTTTGSSPFASCTTPKVGQPCGCRAAAWRSSTCRTLPPGSSSGSRGGA